MKVFSGNATTVSLSCVHLITFHMHYSYLRNQTGLTTFFQHVKKENTKCSTVYTQPLVCTHTHLVHTHIQFRGAKMLQMCLNVVVETITRALFVWSFMVIIVQLYHGEESNALSATLCWIICSRSKINFFYLNSAVREQKHLHQAEHSELELEYGAAKLS